MTILASITFSLYLVLSALDAMLTKLVLSKGGIERNPILSMLSKKIGSTAGILIPKIVAGLIIGIVMYNYPIAIVIGGFGVGFELWACVHNYRVLKKMGR